MEPLTPTALVDVDGLAFDIDDTLTTHGTLTPEAYAALCRLADAGVRLVACTGRPLGWADAFAVSWPVEAAVGENGAGWVRRNGLVLERGYYDDDATRLEKRARLEALAAQVARELPDVTEASDQPARRCDWVWDVGERAKMDPALIDQLLARIEAAGMRHTVSSVHAHAQPGDWDKAKGVVRALELPADEVKTRWAFVGDSGNDAAAFSFFDRSVGVANVRAALPRLPEPPKYVTASERGAGFVELAEALLEARGG